ncbi:MAG: 3-dehydroquinate synthase [Parasphingorhabdus sp.]|jgi:3-dehydroquinate synthase
MNKNVTVNLGSRSYDIVVAPDLLRNCAEHLAPIIKSRRVALITDPYVNETYLPGLATTLDQLSPGWTAFIIPNGESAKSFSGVEKLLSEMLDAGIDRDCVVIAFGGGVVGDVGGFSASLLMRGIDFIQIPTTLMSQVDSAVGGKNGINTYHGKNLVGSFLQPKVVLNDVSLLATLPESELRAGYGEIIKYGILRGETEFSWLEDNLTDILARKPDALVQVVSMGVATKASIVSEDELDKGKRALVNLGHTFAHAFETQAGFGEVPHGHAVAAGLIAAADLSVRTSACETKVLEHIRAHTRSAGLPTNLKELSQDNAWNADAIYASMAHDKKTISGKINFVLIHGLGKPFVNNEVPKEQVLATLRECGAS